MEKKYEGIYRRLALIDSILTHGDLADYYLAHSARAELCRRLGRTAKHVPPTNEPLASRNRSRSSSFSGADWKSCRAETAGSLSPPAQAHSLLIHREPFNPYPERWRVGSETK